MPNRFPTRARSTLCPFCVWPHIRAINPAFKLIVNAFIVINWLAPLQIQRSWCCHITSWRRHKMLFSYIITSLYRILKVWSESISLYSVVIKLIFLRMQWMVCSHIGRIIEMEMSNKNTPIKILKWAFELVIDFQHSNWEINVCAVRANDTI